MIQENIAKYLEEGYMKVKRILFILILVTIVSAIFGSTTFPQEKEVITNTVIVKMVKANLGETVIINKIRTSKTEFDLSTESLIKLKNAGVSDNTINAMIEAQSPQLPPHTEQQVLGSPVPPSGDVFIQQDGKLVEMEYVAGFTKNMTSTLLWGLGGTTTTRFAIIANGEHAQMKITDKNPIFYLRVHPSDVGIVKFDIDTYRKKKVRYVMRVGDLWQTQGYAGGPGESNIDFDFKKETSGLYKITFKRPLNDGEYGIIVAKIGGTGGLWGLANAYKIFDFAVGKP